MLPKSSQSNSYSLTHKVWIGIAIISSSWLSGCVTTADKSISLTEPQGRGSADQLLPVDCLLPAQVRKLGGQMVYLAARKAIKSTARECEIRGGEYVAFDRADYRTSLNVWLEKAKQGDPEAQSYVGEIYEKGLGLPSNYKAAFIWYSKAAKQGYSRAQINLGYLYEKGLGVEKNTLTALNWYRKASGVDDEIDYTAAIEVKAASLAQEQNELLRHEIKRRTNDVEKLKVSLSIAQQQATKDSHALLVSKQQLKQLKQKLDNTPKSTKFNELNRAYSAQIEKIVHLEGSLETLKNKVVITKQTLNRQSIQLNEQSTLLASVDLPGPSIEVFDPSIIITRNGTTKVRVRSGSKVRIISGRIEAPAGLKSATLNGQPIALDSSGLFNAAVTIDAGEKEVLIQVIDQSGQNADFSFIIITEESIAKRGANISLPGRIAGSVDFGRYYAVVIGNNEYQNYPTLQTATNDAEDVATILKEKFGFETQFIRNADRYTILSALNEVKRKLTDKDNLLIYYAGHGERDISTLQGYWLPVDAEQENTANWISNSAISGLLNTMPAKHILVVADSCYSGSMTRSSIAKLDIQLNDKDQEKWLKVMAKTASRTVLTSGGIAPVLDSGGGSNSVFARAFLDQLEQANGLIDAYKIYLNISPLVQKNAANIGFEQSPTYAPIKFTGHSGGEFIFVKSS
jgi:hypothetical protein